MQIFFREGEKLFQKIAATWFWRVGDKMWTLLSRWNIPPAGLGRIRVTRNTLPL
jgi:hypothetical protein